MGAFPSTNWHSFLAKNRNPQTKYTKIPEEENPAPFWGIFPGMPCKPATCSEGISNTNHHRHQPWIPEGPDSDQNDISHFKTYFMQWSLITSLFWRLRPASSIQDQPTIPHTPLPPVEKEKSKLITSGCDLETRWNGWNWWKSWPGGRQCCCWPSLNRAWVLKSGVSELLDLWDSMHVFLFKLCPWGKVWKLTRNFHWRNPLLVLDCIRHMFFSISVVFWGSSASIFGKSRQMCGHLLHRQRFQNIGAEKESR